MKPRISFIVPVRNDAVRLETCLRSIWCNRYAREQIQVLVVDNGSTDGSQDVASRLGADVIVVENVPVSELRNRGAQQATGEVLAFVDADNEVVAGWVRVALETLQIPGVGAVGALYRSPLEGTWVQRAYGHLRGQTRGQRDTAWLSSGNLAVWRHVFEAVHGFDTSLEACEDVDLCQRIRACGHRIVGDARLESVHHGDPRTLQDLFISEQWRGRDNLRVSFRSQVSWTALPSALLPMVNLVMLGVVPIALLMMVTAPVAGLFLLGAAGLIFTAGAASKVVRAVIRDGGVRGIQILQLFAVACVYDLGRALALVARAPHRGARPRAAAAAS